MSLKTRLTTAGRYLIPLTLIFATGESFANGPFDPTFVGGGLFAYSYLFVDDIATFSSIARDSHNRLVVATIVRNPSSGKTEFAATRQLSDGSPDSTFGKDGLANNFSSGDNSYATALAIDHHDRIVLGGSVEGVATCPDGPSTSLTGFALVRLRNDGVGFDGQADFDFGSFGVAFYGDCSHTTAGIAGFAVDNNDYLVVVGWERVAGTNKSLIARWTSSGKLDEGFGDSGVTTTTYNGYEIFPTAVAIDSLGRILVTAKYQLGSGTEGLLVRYTQNGVLDSSFGSSGFAPFGTLGTGRDGYASSVCCLKVDRHDRALIAGTIIDPGPISEGEFEQTSYLVRFTSAGKADETFGGRGFVYLAESAANALDIDRIDRPVVGGYVLPAYFPNAVTAVSHFNLDGTPNAAIGFEGSYTAPIGFSSSYVTSLLVDASGRPTIAAVGLDGDGTTVPVLIRYDELFGEGFD